MHIFTTIPSNKLLRSSVFVYPTETCYGLGCDATNRTLVNRVYAIKGRSFAKPVSWIVANMEMAKEYVVFSKKARELAKRFWPGQLTLVLPLREECKHLAALVRIEWVGLRVSSHPIAREISSRVNRPIVATSANVSGGGECYSVSEVERQLASVCHSRESGNLLIKQRLDSRLRGNDIVYIDCGALARVPPTTVVKVAEDNVEVLRQGAIKLE